MGNICCSTRPFQINDCQARQIRKYITKRQCPDHYVVLHFGVQKIHIKMSLHLHHEHTALFSPFLRFLARHVREERYF